MRNWLIRLLERAKPALSESETATALFDLRADVDALRERFVRFQNRENMRRARGATDADQTLAEDALAILERSTASAEPPAKPPKVDKTELYRKMRH
jgi:hypothetical protein